MELITREKILDSVEEELADFEEKLDFHRERVAVLKRRVERSRDVNVRWKLKRELGRHRDQVNALRSAVKNRRISYDLLEKQTRPLKGFPKLEPFKDYDAARKYLDKEEIQCRICGRKFADLGIHLFKTHKIKSKEYREFFGIPMRSKLIGTKKSNKKRRTGKKLLQIGQCAVARPGKVKQKWHEKHYDKFMRRLEKGRSLRDVGKDADMPAADTFVKNVKKYPRLVIRYRDYREYMYHVGGIKARKSHAKKLKKRKVKK